MKKAGSDATVTAFAPATIGNVGVGFDILGLALSGVGDHVSVTPIFKSREVTISSVQGVTTTIPKDIKMNTAGAAILTMQSDLKLEFGFDIRINKGIPLGSGMGGSAASAVAAVVAAAAVVQKKIKKKLAREALFAYALEGERTAAGASHPDNVAPCLYGGLTLSSPLFSKPVHALPLPAGLFCALVHPDVQVETKQARQILRPDVRLQSYVHQTALLAGFVLGCSTKKVDLIAESLRDLVIEPQRQHLIPAFDSIKAAAHSVYGCLGFSISGSGPSVFALARSVKAAKALAQEIQKQFSLAGITSQAYISRLPAHGARVVRGKL